MVTRIGIGTDLGKAIRYNEQKVREGKAVLAGAAGFPQDESNLTQNFKIRWFNEITSRNQSAKNNALHIVISFPAEEKMADLNLRAIVEEYMELIGFGDQPFLFYRHFDTVNPHLHIVTTNIRWDGSRIDTHQIAKLKSSPARLFLEQKYGLIKASDRGLALLQPLQLDPLQYGQKETKAQISNLVREVMRTYRFASLAEYTNILRHYNVHVDFGEDGSRLQRYFGVSYSAIDADGQITGKPIKGSAIYTKPTRTNIEKCFKRNGQARVKYKARVARIIQDALKNRSKDYDVFKSELSQYGVEIILHNKNQHTFGISFLDTHTRCIFKGSEIGRQYTARMLLANFNAAGNGEFVFNQQFVRDIEKGPFAAKKTASNIRRICNNGLRIQPFINESGAQVFAVGSRHTHPGSFVQPGSILGRYLLSFWNELFGKDGLRKSMLFARNPNLWDLSRQPPGLLPFSIVSHPILPEYYPDFGTYVPNPLLKEAKKKRKKKRRS